MHHSVATRLSKTFLNAAFFPLATKELIAGFFAIPRLFACHCLCRLPPLKDAVILLNLTCRILYSNRHRTARSEHFKLKSSRNLEMLFWQVLESLLYYWCLIESHSDVQSVTYYHRSHFNTGQCNNIQLMDMTSLPLSQFWKFHSPIYCNLALGSEPYTFWSYFYYFNCASTPHTMGALQMQYKQLS